MFDLNDLFYYAQVVEHQGFASAGRALGEPKSKLSRRVARLEKRLGVRLIQRSTRQFSVTEIGHTYYRHCQAMLVEARSAQEAVDLTRSEPCGTVRLTCPMALMDAHVGVMLAKFMAQNPRVEIQLEASNRQVDLVNEGVDIAIRVRPPPLDDSGLVMKVFSDRSQSILASPALVARMGHLQGPAELAQFPSMDHGIPRPDHVWRLEGPKKQRVEIKHRPRLVTGDMNALREAAVAGVGLVQLPTMLVRVELQKGVLVRVLPEWSPPREIIHAVFASRRGLLPSVRALIDYLADEFEALGSDDHYLKT